MVLDYLKSSLDELRSMNIREMLMQGVNLGADELSSFLPLRLEAPYHTTPIWHTSLLSP
jgi:hypothetical protein